MIELRDRESLQAAVEAQLKLATRELDERWAIQRGLSMLARLWWGHLAIEAVAAELAAMGLDVEVGPVWWAETHEEMGAATRTDVDLRVEGEPLEVKGSLIYAPRRKPWPARRGPDGVMRWRLDRAGKLAENIRKGARLYVSVPILVPITSRWDSRALLESLDLLEREALEVMPARQWRAIEVEGGPGRLWSQEAILDRKVPDRTGSRWWWAPVEEWTVGELEKPLERLGLWSPGGARR